MKRCNTTIYCSLLMFALGSCQNMATSPGDPDPSAEERDEEDDESEDREDERELRRSELSL